MMQRIFLGTILVITTWVLQGCAGFPAQKIPVVKMEQLKTEQVKKTKVYTNWDVDFTKIAMNDNVKVASAAIVKKQFDTQLTQTGCCVIVESANEADVVIKGVSHNENNPAAIIPALLTGFSLYAIPSWTTINVHLTADAKNTQQNFKYDVSDSMKLVQWLPMMFAFPFRNPFPMEQDMIDNAYKNVILAMQKDQLFVAK